jgi:hypothetical protein
MTRGQKILQVIVVAVGIVVIFLVVAVLMAMEIGD